MVRKLALGLVILAVLLAATVGLLTWQFSGLVTPRIESFLTGYGVESFATSQVQWRFNRLRIQDIHARGTIEGTPFTLHLERVDTSYQWWRLFHGTIDSIAIGHAHIELDVSTESDADSPSALAIRPLLPQAWLGQLPVSSLSLDSLSGTLRLPGERVLGISGSDWRLTENALEATLAVRELEAGDMPVADTVLVLLEVASDEDEPLAVSVGITHAGRLVANLALSLVGETSWEGLELALHGEIHHRNLHRTLQTLKTLGHPLMASVDALDILPALTGDTRVRLRLRLPDEVVGDFGDWLLDGDLSGAVRHRLAWQAWPVPAIDDARARIRYGVSGSLRAFELSLHRPAVVEGTLAGVSVELPAFFDGWRREAPYRLELNSEHPVRVWDGELSLAGAEALVTLGPEGRHLSAQAQLSDLVVGGDITASASVDLVLHDRGQPLVGLRLQGEGRHTAGDWHLEGDVAEKSMALKGHWQGLLTEAGRYRFSLEGTTADMPEVLKVAGTLLPLDVPLALTAGTGQLRYLLRGGESEGEENLAGEGSSEEDRVSSGQHIALRVSQLTGLLQGIAISDVSLDAIVEEDDSGWHSVEPIEINIGQLHAGVALKDVTAAAQLLPSPSIDHTRWAVDRFEAHLFGGSVALKEPFELSLPPDDAEFDLMLTDWQLGDIFALYAEHGLSGSGILSGRLPVSLREGGVAIAGGELTGQQPGGSIVYDGGEAGKAVASGNQQLDVALRLLNNFQYDTLAVRADFAPDGQLLLGLQLAGRNPDEFDGQAVNFNVNVEENLFDLLRALQLSDDVIKRLEERLER